VRDVVAFDGRVLWGSRLGRRGLLGGRRSLLRAGCWRNQHEKRYNDRCESNTVRSVL